MDGDCELLCAYACAHNCVMCQNLHYAKNSQKKFSPTACIGENFLAKFSAYTVFPLAVNALDYSN